MGGLWILAKQSRIVTGHPQFPVANTIINYNSQFQSTIKVQLQLPLQQINYIYNYNV